MTPFFLLWQVSGAEEAPPEVDGSGLLITKRRRGKEPVRPIDTYRTPEDIWREQLETERYLESLQRVPGRGASTGSGAGVQSPVIEHRERLPQKGPVASPAADPILADVAARAASAVQAKLEEADSAAALGLLAKQQRHRTLVLLLALD